MTIVHCSHINIPVKVGEDAWAKCIRKSFKQPGVSVVTVNESFTRGQRKTYRRIMRRRGWRQYGLKAGPNPIFYHPGVWELLDTRTIKLHGRGEKYKWFPGFNDSRYATVVRLKMIYTGEIHTWICSHWVPEGNKVTNRFRKKSREKSKRIIAGIMMSELAAGHFVHFNADTNIFEKFNFPGVRGQWIRSMGIDKMFAAVPEGYEITRTHYEAYPAPTDHKRGYRGAVEYAKSR